MMNVHGFLTECTTSNIFAVKDGVVFTPALDQGLA
jgi:branched-subunit amino acid aminotransferase/4-amino-4-deoxychorismate lyase